MLADLQKLASRKLAEARVRTASKIDQWEAMVALVRQLGKQAEADITLPDQLVAGIAKARSELKPADYLSALKIDQEATNACNDVKALSKERLQAASNQRAATVQAIKKDLLQAKGNRDTNVYLANNVKQSALAKAKNIQVVKPIKTLDLLGVESGCWVGILGYLILPIIPIIWLIVVIINQSKKLTAQNAAENMICEADECWKSAIAQAENDFKRDRAAAEVALAKAEAYWQKALDAINRLEQSQ